jgi:hypothetical protein
VVEVREGAAEAHALIGIDVIVRFHDITALAELDRAIFSIVGQQYRPIRIILALQRFTEEQENRVRSALAPLLRLAKGIDLAIVNYRDAMPRDARGALLNAGVSAASGRYLAILDYDDTMKPHAYSTMIPHLRNCGAAIAFARTPIANIEDHQDFYYVTGKAHPFEGEGLPDLLEGNFCPIHSYVMDRHRIPRDLLHFEESLAIEEDYEFLLRLCSRVISSFELLNVDIGIYNFKSSQSNTFSSENSDRPGVTKRMKLSRELVTLRRHMIHLSREVQDVLGVEIYTPDLSISDWLSLRHG